MSPNKMSKPSETHYRVFVGNGAMWDWIQGTDARRDHRRHVEHLDGGRDRGRGALDQAGRRRSSTRRSRCRSSAPSFKGGFHVLYGDGSVRFYNEVPKQAAAMITKGGGEVVADE